MCTGTTSDSTALLSLTYLSGLGERSKIYFLEKTAHTLGHRKYVSIIVWITNFVGEKVGVIRHSSLSLVLTTTCALDALLKNKENVLNSLVAQRSYAGESLEEIPAT